jgi:hypothetical protein
MGGSSAHHDTPCGTETRSWRERARVPKLAQRHRLSGGALEPCRRCLAPNRSRDRPVPSHQPSNPQVHIDRWTARQTRRLGNEFGGLTGPRGGDRCGRKPRAGHDDLLGQVPGRSALSLVRRSRPLDGRRMLAAAAAGGKQDRERHDPGRQPPGRSKIMHSAGCPSARAARLSYGSPRPRSS